MPRLCSACHGTRPHAHQDQWMFNAKAVLIVGYCAQCGGLHDLLDCTTPDAPGEFEREYQRLGNLVRKVPEGERQWYYDPTLDMYAMPVEYREKTVIAFEPGFIVELRASVPNLTRVRYPRGVISREFNREAFEQHYRPAPEGIPKKWLKAYLAELKYYERIISKYKRKAS